MHRELIGGAWLRTLYERLANVTSGGQADEDVSPRLYACPTCEKTYISDDMASCPECGEHVDEIPSERELHLSSGGDG